MIEKVIRAQEGDKEALQEIIIENINGLYRIAYAITGNEEDSKDAIGSMTLKVCEKIKTLKNPTFFRTWITRIIINESKNIIKKNKRTTSINEFEKLQSQEEYSTNIAIREAINKLDKNFKEIIILYYYEDFSIKKISDILQIAEGTVKSRLSRARDELRKYNIEKEEI